MATWFVKAAQYVRASGARIGFVATNSITQGEQAAQLWPVLLDDHGMEIAFAHRTFAWGSDARGKAHVHVVIIGLDRKAQAPAQRRLFWYPDPGGDPDETVHSAISPYLTSGDGLSDPHLTIRSQAKPANALPKLVIGSKPVDGGNYIFTDEERDEFLKAEPAATPFLRPYIGAREYIQGTRRWILALHNAEPHDLAQLPLTRQRITAVKTFRQSSRAAGTRQLAHMPTLYHVNIIPDAPFLVIPKSSAQRREYVPIGWLEPPTIAGDALFVLKDATLTDFGLLTSAMHMAWLRQTGGRLKSDYRYSIGIVYNTFPTPAAYRSANNRTIAAIETAAQAVLDARDTHPTSSLAALYDPDLMPPDLRRAHQALDKAVDRLYMRSRFTSERDRVEHLLSLYEQAQARLKLQDADKPKRRRASKRPAASKR